jgi:hypothetical protein
VRATERESARQAPFDAITIGLAPESERWGHGGPARWGSEAGLPAP